ncbi:MAG: YjfI family protein [Proteobacteria bacterium]|nr:YjfI family protein [Pseudomonadota bacterium]
MAPKKSSYYQSRYRARLRENGYVKREIWIPPDYTKILKDCETALRAGVMPFIPRTVTERKMSEDRNWTTETLYEALAQSETAGEGEIEVELVEGTDPGILITMTEFGDLPLLMSVSGSQILVDTLLWPVDEVSDPAAFNEMIMKTHKLLPLSTFGIRQGPDGREYYEMFGSLSAGSILESILFEIETLADNAMQAADAYQSDLKDVA